MALTITSITDLEALIGDVQGGTRSITSLSIRIPINPEIVQSDLSVYSDLYKQRDENPTEDYSQFIARISREAYETQANQRVEWVNRFRQAFDRLLTIAKNDLVHLEYVVPDYPEPFTILNVAQMCLKLESLSIQWKHTKALPYTVLPHEIIVPSLDQFRSDLLKFISDHSSTLQRLRLSLPIEAYGERYPSFTTATLKECLMDASILPHLQVLDLTHSSPWFTTLTSILEAHPSLQHLILDQGAEFRDPDMTGGCMEDDEEEEEEAPTDLMEKWGGSWTGLGLFLARHPDIKLQSICASMAFMYIHIGGFGISRGYISKAIEKGLKVDGDEGKQMSIAVCSAWPSESIPEEAVDLPGYDKADEADMYKHAEGCGHLVGWPDNQRPTNIWPPHTTDSLSSMKPGVY